MKLTRPSIALGLLVAALSACGSESAADSPSTTVAEQPGTSLPSDFDQEWQSLIDAAKDEGAIVFITGATGEVSDEPVFQAFADEFDLEMTSIGGASDLVTSRVLAERTQGLYTVDISASMGGNGIRPLVEGGAFTPLDPLLVHPDILDRSEGWRLDYVPYADEPGTFCTNYAVQAAPNFLDLWYNTDNVSQADLDSIESWDDINDPRWDGRVGIGDIASGEQSFDRTLAWMNLGEDWFDALLHNDPTVLPFGSAREHADALARGEFDLGTFPPGGELSLVDARNEGLPVERFPRTMVEGPQASTIERLCVLDQAPHPNAAKLFVNWILTREGQTVFNELTGHEDKASLRTDVPQGNVPDDIWTLAGDTRLPVFHDNTDEFRAAEAESREWLEATFSDLGLSPGS